MTVGNAFALGAVEIDKLGVSTKLRECYGSGLPGGSFSRVGFGPCVFQVLMGTQTRTHDAPKQNLAIPPMSGPESSFTSKASYPYSSIRLRLPFGAMRK
jgi:hypothetical protein